MLDRKFMPKISTKHYSTGIESMGDSCMHFKMPMGAGVGAGLGVGVPWVRG